VGITIKIASAWVEPTAMPPGGNIAAPLNTGNVGQSKVGGLTLNVGGSTYGLIVQNGLVGIGTTAPGEKLEVNGNILLTGGNSNDNNSNTNSPVYTIKNVAAPVNDTDVATKGYVDAASGGTASDSLTANEGAYSNKIPDMTPPTAYSEVCFKNGTTQYDNHDGSSTTEGGNCLPGDTGFIIEKNQRDAQHWPDARAACTQIGMRLPEPFEYIYACDHLNNNFSHPSDKREWISNSTHQQTSQWSQTINIDVSYIGNISGNCYFTAPGEVTYDGVPSDPVGPGSYYFRCVR